MLGTHIAAFWHGGVFAAGRAIFPACARAWRRLHGLTTAERPRIKSMFFLLFFVFLNSVEPVAWN